MTTVIKLFGGDLGDIEAFFSCDLSQASSPLRQWNEEDERWAGTQYQCADCSHDTEHMADLAMRLAADAVEVAWDDFECEWEVVDETYSVSDSDRGLTFDEAVERVADWYSDADQWAGHGDSDTHAAIREAIDSIDQPEDGDIDDLQAYVRDLREAVAKAMGGRGSYAVSAASEIGLDLKVELDPLFA